jgi:hypothetical protein
LQKGMDRRGVFGGGVGKDLSIKGFRAGGKNRPLQKCRSSKV